ncbi:MAG: response regulator [Candidatus Eisenbacteria bacterium]|uniref:Response regulator n=1 Tax=Eiseniibacteriota bacterium TaxID=2212470 RepID=A0A933SE22_UNCEI|nr:response regulator [Candidatus Eisenbacteria bacterium]
MNEQATLLLVDRDPAHVETFRRTLELERRVRLVISLNPVEALKSAHDLKPDLVVVTHDIPGMNAFSFCQMLRSDPALAGAMIVLTIPAGANELRFAGLTHGVDEYLTHPIEPAEVLTKLHSMLRMRDVYEQLLRDKVELEELRDHLRSSFDQMLQLLTHILDLRLPGAGDRGRRIAELALQVAGRFGIPETHLRDMEIAARLHELGRILKPGAGTDSAPAMDDWQYILSTRAIFSKVEGLDGATEVVGAIYENWDGTGRPEHWVQGQIPLRSRILRVIVDLFERLALPGAPGRDEVLDEMQNFAGTRYDAMVLVHLRSVLRGESGDVRGDRVLVPVPELKVDMVLAEDLCTESGIKLLARNTRISSESLETIRRRHSLEPIISGAAILRKSAA